LAQHSLRHKTGDCNEYGNLDDLSGLEADLALEAFDAQNDAARHPPPGA
jgi:hypothetical protein